VSRRVQCARVEHSLSSIHVNGVDVPLRQLGHSGPTFIHDIRKRRQSPVTLITCRSWSRTETRRQLCVALTRGRSRNDLHLVLAGDSAHPAAPDLAALRLRAAAELLRRIINIDDSARSTAIPHASSPIRALSLPGRRLAICETFQPGDPAGTIAALPWLGEPATTASALNDYLRAQADNISPLARRAAHQAIHSTTPARPWVAQLRRTDPALLGRAAIWQAAHHRPLNDARLASPEGDIRPRPTTSASSSTMFTTPSQPRNVQQTYVWQESEWTRDRSRLERTRDRYTLER
jgi:hypothetical protein